MKKILVTLFILIAAPASAQNYLRDNGTFQSVVTGTTPGQCLINSAGSLGGGPCGQSPGGTPGQIQFNSAGAFGGFTVSGDGTLNTATGALTVTATNGAAFGGLATVTPGTGVVTAAAIAVNTAGGFTTQPVANASLQNASTTVNGQTCTLGASCTVTATATNILTFGTHLTSGGASYNGSAPITITSDATSANTASTIVARDGSGNLSAGTITASLTGHSSLDLALTGGTMSGAIAMGTNAITGLTTLASAGAMTFQSNGSTNAGAINTSQQWGIFNTSPKTTLDVNANSSSSPALILATSVVRVQAADTVSGGIEFTSYGAGVNAGVIISGGVAAGTAASPTPPVSGQYMYNMRGYGYNSGWQSAALWLILTAEAWSAGHQGTVQDWYTTPIGSTTIAQAMRLQASGGLSIGINTDPGIGSLLLNAQMFMPNITTSSSAASGSVCWTTGTGKFTVDTTVACLTSIMAAKNITERLTAPRALEIIDRLSPFAFRYKAGWGDGGRYEQFGFGAEEVAVVDERLVGRDPEGKLQGVRYQELTAVLAGAIQELRMEIENTKRNFH
jgi:hypothetical protein